MQHWTIRWLAALFLLVVFPLCAEPGRVASPTAEQQAAYLLLEQRIASAAPSELAKLAPVLAAETAHPLYPYLQYQWLKRTLSPASEAALSEFFAAFPHHHLTHALRSKWLDQRFADKDAKGFARWFENGLSLHHYCQSLWLARRELSAERLAAEIQQLWLTPHSLPNSCDPLLAHWQQQGGLTTALLLQRFVAVAQSGDMSLLGYLGRKLPAEYQYLVRLWQDTRQSPHTVLAYSRFPGKQPAREREIIAFGLEKLAWQQTDKAISGFHRWHNQQPFPRAQRVAIEKAIALNLALQNRPEAATWMRALPSEDMTLDILRWQLAHHVRQQEWHNALQVAEAGMERFTADELLYWAGRSLAALEAEQRAAQVMQLISPQRSYYGFAASAFLRQAPQLQHQPAPVSASLLQTMADAAPMQRISWLIALGRQLDARREWRDWLPLLSAEELLHLAVLASEHEWHELAFHAFSQSGYLDDVARRFPLAHQQLFGVNARKHQVSSSFAMAIARRESAFRPDAVSSKGARGLMQLMPGTAAFINKTSLSPTALFEPETNVALGIAYIAYLQEKWNEQPILVAASYNAGWQKVTQWLPTQQPVAADIWIDSIPYKETREYVKAVLTYQQIYESQLQGNPRLFQQLISDRIAPL